MTRQINISDIQRAVQNSIPLVFRLTGLLPPSFPLLDRILEIYLTELGQEEILEPLSYCLKELISNAQKANAKRLFFEEHDLEIFHKDDYEKGMKSFFKEMSHNVGHFLQGLRERRLSIDVTFHSREETLVLSVGNDSALAPVERARIEDRIARARAYHSFFEVLEESVDKTEGAGLGIMILIQFLKRLGLGEEAFSIRSGNGRTVASIVLPIPEVHLEQVRILSEVLVRDIESLPHFPENVVSLMRLTDRPDATVVEISRHVSTDPTLTAELLRQVNSAYYGAPARVNNVLQAVKLIGVRRLHLLLYSFGFQRVLDENRARLKSLWEHSLRTAYYAFLLARDLKHQREILDDAYVAGILHDLGFIVVTSLHPQTQEKMRRFSMEKNIPPRILERFSFGMNHADIGALIAEKWNFPDQLVEAIKYHHEPLLASRRYKDVVFCVYLANALCDLERRFISYEQLEKPVLADFELTSKERFLAVASRLKSVFERRQDQSSLR